MKHKVQWLKIKEYEPTEDTRIFETGNSFRCCPVVNKTIDLEAILIEVSYTDDRDSAFEYMKEQCDKYERFGVMEKSPK